MRTNQTQTDGPRSTPPSGSAALDKFWLIKGARFTELLHVGGFNPSSYGCITSGGLYGRTGLSQDEFFESIQMIAYVDGMIAVLGDNAVNWLKARIGEETQKRQRKAERCGLNEK